MFFRHICHICITQGDAKVKDTIEIRWHGRGGQGAKTAALLLADVAFKTGKYVQGFPEYGAIVVNTPKSADEIRPHLNGYKGKVYTLDAREISMQTLGKNFPNSPMLAAIVAVSGIMEKDAFLADMRVSYKHKFAKKPEVIEGNMKALELAFAEVTK